MALHDGHPEFLLPLAVFGIGFCAGGNASGWTGLSWVTGALTGGFIPPAVLLTAGYVGDRLDERKRAASDTQAQHESGDEQ